MTIIYTQYNYQCIQGKINAEEQLNEWRDNFNKSAFSLKKFFPLCWWPDFLIFSQLDF